MLTATLALALSLAPAQGEALSLKWQFKAGDTFYAKTLTTLDSKMGLMGQAIDLKQEMTSVTRYKVKSAEASGVVLEITYTDLKMSGLPGVDLSGTLDKVKGKTVTATLNNKYEVTKLDGQKKLADDLGDDPLTKALVGAMLSEDAAKQTIAGLFTMTPDKPVKLGDTWDKTESMDAGGGKVTAKTKFKLSKVESDAATVDSTAEASIKVGDIPGLPFKVTKADFKVEKYTGSSVFDIKAGRLKESTSDMSVTGAATLSVMGNDFEATLGQKVKSVTTISDKNPIKD